jgi:hypothetical protein
MLLITDNIQLNVIIKLSDFRLSILKIGCNGDHPIIETVSISSAAAKRMYQNPRTHGTLLMPAATKCKKQMVSTNL